MSRAERAIDAALMLRSYTANGYGGESLAIAAEYIEWAVPTINDMLASLREMVAEARDGNFHSGGASEADPRIARAIAAINKGAA